MIKPLGARILFLALLLPLLAACNSPNFRLSEDGGRVGPPPPLGTPRVRDGVDGMTVGDRLMEAAEFELALQAYQRAATEVGLNADVLSAIGAANLKLGRLNQAKVFLEKAVDVNPDSVPAWNNFGVVLINLGELHQAREAFKVAFGLDNGDSDLIRDNLILANELIEQQVAEIPEEADFRLVRQGQGSYLLLGN